MKQSSDEQIVDLKGLDLGKGDAVFSDKSAVESDKSDKLINNDNVSRNNAMEWQALEFQYFSKSRIWFAVLFFIAVVIEIYFIVSGDFFAFATFLLVFFVVFLYAVKKPRFLRLKIDNQGVYIDSKLYAFDEMKSFWLSYDPPEIKEIFFKRKGTIYADLIIPLGNQDPVIARIFLKKYLPEVKKEESLFEALMKKIRF
ncbi:MAG: hypothetical protein AAB397_00670 [Patescibacteria group bacterium]